VRAARKLPEDLVAVPREWHAAREHTEDGEAARGARDAQLEGEAQAVREEERGVERLRCVRLVRGEGRDVSA
jgi:hypothetical protein